MSTENIIIITSSIIIKNILIIITSSIIIKNILIIITSNKKNKVGDLGLDRC